MNRYFLEIAYKGTNYHGWQVQKNSNSVQAEINKALSTLLQSEIMVTGAGRTDTGVHAKQLYAHFDIELEIDTSIILYKVNNFLPEDISCQSITKVKEGVHARFSAIARTYEYHIIQKKNPFLTDSAFFFPHELDLNLMNEAGKELLKHVDFSCFSKSKTGTFTNNCKISWAKWKKENDQLIFTISADRFLRNMVRAIVGTLLDVGQRKIHLDDLKKIIESKNRSKAGQSVPAQGLYLCKVDYPKGDLTTF